MINTIMLIRLWVLEFGYVVVAVRNKYFLIKRGRLEIEGLVVLFVYRRVEWIS